MDVLENGRTDSNVVASYVYQGIASTAEDKDQGAVSLALVPSNEPDDTDVFVDYAYGEIYKRAIGAYVVNDSALMTDINNMLSAAGSSTTVSAGSTPSDVFGALEEIRAWADSAGQDTSTLDSVLFVVDVVNPGYYNSVEGFIGSDTLNTPSWADELTGTGDPFVGDIEVSAGSIAAADFTVTMPEPATPDF
jgi:hypothetical protein